MILPDALRHEFFDLINTQHFINLLPDRVKECCLAIPRDYFLLTESQLITKVFGSPGPDAMDCELRLNFWAEYDLKFQNSKMMEMKEVYRGVCSDFNFYNAVIVNPGRLMFIITESAVNKSKQRYLFHLGIKRMEETLKAENIPHFKTGRLDTALMGKQFEIFQYIDQRLHGSNVQKSEQVIQSKNVNVNIDATPESPTSLEAVNQRIKELENEEILTIAPILESPMEKVVVEAGKVSKEFAKERSEY